MNYLKQYILALAGGMILSWTMILSGAEPVVAELDPLAAEPKLSSSSAVADSAVTADNTLATLEEDIVPPEVVVSEVEDDWRELRQWFSREKHALWIMSVKVTLGLLLGVAIAWLLHWLFRLPHVKKGQSNFALRMWQAVSGPLVLILTLVWVFFSMQKVLLTVPGGYAWEVRIFFAGMVFTVTWGLFHLVELLTEKLTVIARRDTNNLDCLMVVLIGKVLKLSLLALALVFVVRNVFNLHIGTLLTGAGIIGLALAFSAKDMLANFFGSIVIVMDKPFQVGDRIKIDDCNGIVTQVGIRSTRILTEDEDIFTIPNSIFTSNKVINISRKGKIKYIFTINLTYSTTADEMKLASDILHKIVDDFHGEDLPEYKPRIFFSSLSNWSMNIKVIMWLKSSDFKVIEEYVNEINFAIVREFNANKLNMAFPTSSNYLLSDPDNPLLVSVRQPDEVINNKN